MSDAAECSEWTPYRRFTKLHYTSQPKSAFPIFASQQFLQFAVARRMIGDPAFLFTQLTAYMKYKNEIKKNKIK